jgi:uncharacterized membrane protein YebE (DUF533 family)
MNPDFLIRGVVASVLGGRPRKRSRRALRYLTGGQGSSMWMRPTTLLTAAGVAWGIYETLQQNGAQAATGAGAAAAAMPAIPPLPGVASSADSEALRLVQLAISAANADGVMTETERAAVLQHAQSAGVGDIVERELNHPRPLAEIVAGITDPAQRATLYVLAFGVLRADEQVSGAERIYLAQLAHLLNLDPADVQRLETETGERIDAVSEAQTLCPPSGGPAGVVSAFRRTRGETNVAAAVVHGNRGTSGWTRLAG